MVEKLCQKCGEEFSSKHSGRPKVYCSTTCRRAAEFELRPLHRSIAKLKRSAENLRGWIRAGDDTYIWGWGRPTEALPAVEKELAEARAELANILGKSESKRLDGSKHRLHSPATVR